MKQETKRILAVLCLWAAQAASAEDVIRTWVDHNGRTHYSNVDPNKNLLHRLVPGAPEVDSSEVTRAQARAHQAREQLVRWQSSRPVGERVPDADWVSCERALRMIQVLGEYPELPLMRAFDDGSVAPLTSADRRLHLERAAGDIRAHCDHAIELNWNAVLTGLFWPRTARAAATRPTMFIPPPIVTDTPASLDLRRGTPLPPRRP